MLSTPRSLPLAALLCAAAAVPAAAQPGRIVNQHGGRCLAVQGAGDRTGNGVNVHQWQCTRVAQPDNLRWELEPDGPYVRIVNRHSGKCLAVQGTGRRTADGINVHQWQCADVSQPDNLRWDLRPDGAYYRIVNAHSGKCLALQGAGDRRANGVNVHQWDCDRARQPSNLRWQVAPATSRKPLVGDVGCMTGGRAAADCNRCVKDVVGTVSSLGKRGRPIDLPLARGYPALHKEHHIQGIQRLAPDEPGRGVGYLIVTSDHGALGAHIGVVQLSDDEAPAEALALHSAGEAAPTSYPEAEGPWMVGTVRASLAYAHPGGLQVLGRYAVIPLEDGLGAARDGPPALQLWDFANPTAPRLVWEFPLPRGDRYRPSHNAATTAVAKLADGRYLLLSGRRDTDLVDVFVSTGTDLTEPAWERLATVRAFHPRGGGRRSGRKYQNVDLVTECETGDLYVLATHNTGGTVFRGSNFLDVYRLEIYDRSVFATKVLKRRFDCDARGKRRCNFDAGVGIYVDETHQITLYATDRAGSKPGDPVPIMEFRPERE